MGVLIRAEKNFPQVLYSRRRKAQFRVSGTHLDACGIAPGTTNLIATSGIHHEFPAGIIGRKHLGQFKMPEFF